MVQLWKRMGHGQMEMGVKTTTPEVVAPVSMHTQKLFGSSACGEHCQLFSMASGKPEHHPHQTLSVTDE